MTTKQSKYNIGDLVKIQDIHREIKSYLDLHYSFAIILSVNKNQYAAELTYSIYDILNTEYTERYESSICELLF